MYSMMAIMYAMMTAMSNALKSYNSGQFLVVFWFDFARVLPQLLLKRLPLFFLCKLLVFDYYSFGLQVRLVYFHFVVYLLLEHNFATLLGFMVLGGLLAGCYSFASGSHNKIIKEK